MKRLLFVPLVLLGGCLWGCEASGSRFVEVEIFGQRIAVRDTVAPNSEGKTEYKVGLDDDSNLLKQMFGWMFPSKEAPPESTKLLAAGKLVGMSGKAPHQVPKVTYHLAVVSEPSGMTITTHPPSCGKVLIAGSPFFVEVWATKSSPDLDPDPPHDPGISCAYVDLMSHEAVDEIDIEHSVAFAVGAPFVSGSFDGNGGVVNLGSCTFAPGGVGVGPEWALLATIQLQKDDKGKVRFELADPTNERLGTSVYGQGYADPDYGKACQSNVQIPRE